MATNDNHRKRPFPPHRSGAINRSSTLFFSHFQHLPPVCRLHKHMTHTMRTPTAAFDTSGGIQCYKEHLKYITAREIQKYFLFLMIEGGGVAGDIWWLIWSLMVKNLVILKVVSSIIDLTDTLEWNYRHIELGNISSV